MARIAGVDLPREKRVEIGLTYIYGIGLATSGNIFRDNAPPKPGPGVMSVDRKLRRRIQEKKIAMGHKPDDHEEYQGPSMTM